jgi:methionyl-tRNA formyltransferase
MRIIYFGSSEFGLPALQAMQDTGHKIVCVITQPDRKKGRGLAMARTPIKDFALGSSKIDICQPQDVNSAESIKFIKSLKPELFVVIAYGQILSEELLGVPQFFAINAHASLLPRYRGAAPINWAIINGEKVTGITIIKMNRQMDAGPMIFRAPLEIKTEDTFITLQEKLSKLAAGAIIDSIKHIETNRCTFTPQDETLVTQAPKLRKEDGLIKWQDSALRINNLIRGCVVWPGAFTYYKDRLLKVCRARVCMPDQVAKIAFPGAIVGISSNSIIVAAGEGALTLEEVQPEGKRKMTAKAFIAGHHVAVGDIFKQKIVAF